MWIKWSWCFMGTEWIDYIRNEHWTRSSDPWILLIILPVMVIDFGQITWTICSIVSLFVSGTTNRCALAIFTRFLIQCVWDYGSRTGILSNSLDASRCIFDNIWLSVWFRKLCLRVTAADMNWEEASKGIR